MHRPKQIFSFDPMAQCNFHSCLWIKNHENRPRYSHYQIMVALKLNACSLHNIDTMTVMTIIICILFTKVHGDRWDCKNWANSTALGEVIINSVFDRKVVIYSGTRKKERRVKSKSTPQPFQEYTGSLSVAGYTQPLCQLAQDLKTNLSVGHFEATQPGQ